ncbi:MAG: 16S rRNA (guanine(527)-N(7))-methyltransferase RsmG [Chloroflexi bacterium]|nr:16S rRNA (guanine(527)-N(7))-methyltransferase RsmG [Chloroflexota bacterium]
MSQLVHTARAFGLQLDAGQLAAFEQYYRELNAWNTRVNLTAITEREQVIVKHFLDSLSVAPQVHSAITLIDIGAGAGFPGVPLKIALPHLRVTLLEATRKKAEFLKHLIAQFELSNTIAVQARAEDLARDAAHREQYDCAVARAVAELATLLEYSLPFVKVGGIFIAQKGNKVEDEIRRAERALTVLGGRVREIVPVQLPGLELRHLVVVEKTARTPSTYPRRAGIPERKPIR